MNLWVWICTVRYKDKDMTNTEQMTRKFLEALVPVTYWVCNMFPAQIILLLGYYSESRIWTISFPQKDLLVLYYLWSFPSLVVRIQLLDYRVSRLRKPIWTNVFFFTWGFQVDFSQNSNYSYVSIRLFSWFQIINDSSLQLFISFCSYF